MLAAFLQKVGIASCFRDDPGQGVGGDIGLLRPDRFGNRIFCRPLIERADLAELEQAFGVGLGLRYLRP